VSIVVSTDRGWRPEKFLQLVLVAAALHSTAVGLGLILHPASILAKFGYAPVTEEFFPTQGGVFHVIMAVGYLMAAAAPRERRSLIVFAIIVKMLATVFLLVYWLFVSRLWMVFGSAIGDGALAGILWFAYRSWRARSAFGGR